MIENGRLSDVGARRKIVLIAGRVSAHGRLGHHDYSAGCALLSDLLARAPGVDSVVVEGGWPQNEDVLDDAAALVFYDGGNGKQAFLSKPRRIERLRQAAQGGVGIAMFHQAVAFPAEYRALGCDWLGGAYVPAQSRRGHWKSVHEDFPDHPVTRGVEGWAIRDGWLNGIQFTADPSRIVPLLWSGKTHRGNAAGGNDEIVAWLYTRADGGRSFAFTGLDAHTAWSHEGLRLLVANAIVWSCGLEAPTDPHWTHMSGADIKAYMTPRRSPLIHELRKVRRVLHPRGRW